MATRTQIKPTDTTSFLLKIQDIQMLSRSDGFTLLREHLAQHCNFEFCDEHKFADPENISNWLVVRDILHALLVPVVELFDKAVSLAVSTSRATQSSQLDLSFSGQARRTFLQLEDFLSSSKERDWCYTKGCPACVVRQSLESESSIRLLFAACLLSDVHYPFTLEGPTLPSFRFFLDYLEEALAEDPRVGKDIFELTQPKAEATRNGIEELIHQCLELEHWIEELRNQPKTKVSFISDPTQTLDKMFKNEPSVTVNEVQPAG